MTIFITTFDTESKEALEPSADSGFSSLEEVLAIMGDGFLSCSARLIIYPGVAFSDYRFV